MFSFIRDKLSRDDINAKPQATKKKDILLIDDDREIWTIMEKYVGKSCNLHCFEYLESCESVYKKTALPDLILIDINLGHQNGFRIARRLRSYFPKTIPLIYISTEKNYKKLYEETQDINSFFIPKPFDRTSIALTLHAFLA